MPGFRWVYTAYFNSQPHEEADSDSGRTENHRTHFNSQPHEEADSSVSSSF